MFRGENQWPANFKELVAPYDCFRYFLTDEIIQSIAEQSNLYARQKDIATKFVGVLICMSVYRYPNVRSY